MALGVLFSILIVMQFKNSRFATHGKKRHEKDTRMSDIEWVKKIQMHVQMDVRQHNQPVSISASNFNYFNATFVHFRNIVVKM